jgi:hypothetical protein
MCTVISNGISKVGDNIWGAGQTAVEGVQGFGEYLGRKFENLTNALLPAVVARIVQKVVYSAPFIAATLVMPAYLQLAAIGTYAIVHIAHKISDQEGHGPFNNSFYSNLYNGIGTAFLYKAGCEVYNIYAEEKLNLVVLAVQLIVASFFIEKGANCANKAAPAQVELIDAPPAAEEAVVEQPVQV